jgi:hypothetical protein
MKVEHITFLDSRNYLPFPLRKLTDAFGLTSSKSWYSHYFNTSENLDYIGPVPDVYYFVDAMDHSEMKDFLAWYEGQKGKTFNNRHVLESYFQDDVTVLPQACQIFRRNFVEIGNIEVFLEVITIASACNKVFRKEFLTPDALGLIPTGGYTNNSPQSTKGTDGWVYDTTRRERS